VTRHPKTLAAAFLACFLACFLAVAACAQTAKPAAPAAKETVSALMVSDIHFEPFWDPGKAHKLAAAPASEWKSILAAAPSPDREQQFAALHKSCHTRGDDSSFALYESSLKAIHAQAADAKFATVSGDLVSHSFSCKYQALFSNSSSADYRAFVKKTLKFVIDELSVALPGVPVYVALGNNDSDCGDYQLDTHSEFLSVTGKEVTKFFPAAEQAGAQATFAVSGDYSVTLPAPVQHARLLALNDLFMSKHYATCAGAADPAAADAQIVWLRGQLTAARANKEKIWVMAHIPPGVDPFSTAKKLDNVCGGQGPEMFLSNDKLAAVLADFDDVIQLAIFAHTHMDELRILRPENNTARSKGTAVKLVSSISPINGNSPSFTLARVDPATAALLDYRVIAASNSTGIDTAWKEEYDFARGFHRSAFTASSVSELVTGFTADPSAKTQASQDYINHFSVGYLSPVLTAFWPQYACALSNYTAGSYRACVCTAPGK